MRVPAVILFVALSLGAGCAGNGRTVALANSLPPGGGEAAPAAFGTTGIRPGTPITQVQADCGRPDAISDAAGDQTRFYRPTDRPEYEWSADALRTFYYLGRDLAVTFVLGRAVRAGPIDPELRDVVLACLAATRPSGGG